MARLPVAAGAPPVEELEAAAEEEAAEEEASVEEDSEPVVEAVEEPVEVVSEDLVPVMWVTEPLAVAVAVAPVVGVKGKSPESVAEMKTSV